MKNISSLSLVIKLFAIASCIQTVLSIDLLHGRFLVNTSIAFIKLREGLISTCRFIFINRQTQLDETMNSVSECLRFIERETRRQQRRVVEKPDKVLDGFVTRISGSFVAE